jgi:hypothetical protein
MDFIVYPDGADVFAAANQVLIVTDLIRGLVYEASVIDFFIDDQGNGTVFMDGEPLFMQSNVEDYDVLQSIFYSQYSVQNAIPST